MKTDPKLTLTTDSASTPVSESNACLSTGCGVGPQVIAELLRAAIRGTLVKDTALKVRLGRQNCMARPEGATQLREDCTLLLSCLLLLGGAGRRWADGWVTPTKQTDCPELTAACGPLPHRFLTSCPDKTSAPGAQIPR